MRSVRDLLIVALSIGALAGTGCGVNDDSITGTVVSNGGGGGGNTNLSIAISGGNAQSGTVSQFVGDSLAVRVTSNGQPAAGVNVDWTVVLGGGNLSATSTVTGANGIAKVRYALGPFPGRNTVRATVAGANPVEFTETAQ
ncbi:MAG: DUF4198 domain-containing protein [Gemmatimonadota bacterium]|nr:DUF4198 domain-containing protein [Gemmatimonadota bacterium]